MLIRAESERDWAPVHAVVASAFGRPAEADLVEALRQRARPIVSLVAEIAGAIVGHVMFSPVRLSGHDDLKFMGLAPLAVAPSHQRRGIGTALVTSGLERCRELGFGAVVVLGDPAYYARFGFSAATRFGIGCDYDVPEDAFMIVELQHDFLRGAPGTVTYDAAFGDLPAE
jgi:putative acetyltransferase